MISDEQKQALFLDLHRAIEESALNAVKQIESTKDVSLPYPPNGGLSENEQAGISKLILNPTTENYCRCRLVSNFPFTFFNRWCFRPLRSSGVLERPDT
jgi:hypothetical protein